MLDGAFELQRCPHHNRLIFFLKKHFGYFWKLNICISFLLIWQFFKNGLKNTSIVDKINEKHCQNRLVFQSFLCKNWPSFWSISKQNYCIFKRDMNKLEKYLVKTVVVRKRNVLSERISPHCTALTAKSIIKA